jgi:hypothetical protein
VRNQWAPLPPLKLSMTLHHTQGADVADGAVWISTSDPTNDVFRVDQKTGTTTLAGTLGHTGAEGEGFDATPTKAGRFTAVINDLQHGKVYVGHYDLDDGNRDNNGPWVAIVAVLAVLVLVGVAADWAWRRRRTPS